MSGSGANRKSAPRRLAITDPDRYPNHAWENISNSGITNRPQIAWKRPQQKPATLGRRLLEIVVYGKQCRIGSTVTLDDLAETSEIGDWKMATTGWPVHTRRLKGG